MSTKPDRNTTGAVVLITIGLLLLFTNLTGFGVGTLIARFWPLILVVIGVSKLQRKDDTQEGVAIAIVGLLLLLFTLDIFRWSFVSNLWPVALIAVGALLLLKRSGNAGASTTPTTSQTTSTSTQDRL